ncbi:MAG: cob(I)yrinic acid a,c-diamide adenosyltransferase [Opitutales bacterium]|nr:cob(I)yrinic acid a,c-diamide adenosyltransferase [Opitutales bacterium]
MKISTKGGDKGSTSLMFGKRVSKACQRVRTYGMVDELSATIAMARAFAKDDNLAKQLLCIQENLVLLMTELATAKEDFPKLAQKNIKLLDDTTLDEIESKIDEIESKGNIFNGWKHAGDTPLSAALDMARVKCRATEREIVALNEEEGLARNFPLVYINRLSDYIYLLSIN